MASVKNILKQFINRLPYVRTLHREVALYKKNCYFPAGHYYSPVVSIEEVEQRAGQIWKSLEQKEISGIDLHVEEQLQLCLDFEKYQDSFPYSNNSVSHRYQPGNTFFGLTDAFVLYAFIRKYQPARIIEVGSGFSTALMLDCLELFPEHPFSISSIEPDPSRLSSLLRGADKQHLKLMPKPLQDVPLSFFEQLEANDILFIDSTHVSKTGSDVNRLLFDIFPLLKPGVIIHIHDIFHAFEYPLEWVKQGRNWNEGYLVRAFLSHNEQYRILCFPHYLQSVQREALSSLPLLLKDRGQSLWLIKN